MQQLTPTTWYQLRPAATSVYALLLWNLGSRHDPPGKEGLSHFLEHMLFKGTRRHTGRSISHRIERLGGDLNAFTTKDKIGIEVRIAPSGLITALATLRELAHEATFPEKEIDKEREVILEELAMYEDIPEESLLDHFEEQIFAQGGLRHPIIGYASSVRSITVEDLRRFYEDRLKQSTWVLVLTGALAEKDILSALRRTGWLTEPQTTATLAAESEKFATPAILHFRRPIQQAHLVIGGIGPALYEWENSIALQLLLHALGGGMSSRLFLRLRERYGWCYTVYSFFHGYPEQSIWGIYAGLTPESLKAARRVILRELAQMVEQPLSTKYFTDLRRGFIGKQLLLWESPIFQTGLQARAILDTGAPLDISTWQQIARNLTPYDLQKVAEKAFQQLHERAYLPTENENTTIYNRA